MSAPTGGQVDSAIFLIQARGLLDLSHFYASRQIDRDDLLR
jgi:hypothetical protein